MSLTLRQGEKPTEKLEKFGEGLGKGPDEGLNKVVHRLGVKYSRVVLPPNSVISLGGGP